LRSGLSLASSPRLCAVGPHAEVGWVGGNRRSFVAQTAGRGCYPWGSHPPPFRTSVRSSVPHVGSFFSSSREFVLQFGQPHFGCPRSAVARLPPYGSLPPRSLRDGMLTIETISCMTERGFTGGLYVPSPTGNLERRDHTSVVTEGHQQPRTSFGYDTLVEGHITCDLD